MAIRKPWEAAQQAEAAGVWVNVAGPPYRVWRISAIKRGNDTPRHLHTKSVTGPTAEG